MYYCIIDGPMPTHRHQRNLVYITSLGIEHLWFKYKLLQQLHLAQSTCNWGLHLLFSGEDNMSSLQLP